MLRSREASILALGDISLHCLHGNIVKISILLDEFRAEAIGYAQKVIANQYLTVAAITGADADGSHGLQLSSNLSCQFCRNALQYAGKSACFLQCLGILNHFLRSLNILTLYLEATQLVHGLGSKTNVRANGNAGSGELLN